MNMGHTEVAQLLEQVRGQCCYWGVERNHTHVLLKHMLSVVTVQLVWQNPAHPSICADRVQNSLLVGHTWQHGSGHLLVRPSSYWLYSHQLTAAGAAAATAAAAEWCQQAEG